MIKILVLDDEKGLCRKIQDFFVYRGYKVFAANTGKDALAVLKKESPQILVLDIKMDGINGLDVLKKAKEDNPNVKAVMVTALAEEATRKQAKALGADEYITKPFSYDDLEKLIIRFVNDVLRLEEAQNK